jgi:hypothetical protein
VKTQLLLKVNTVILDDFGRKSADGSSEAL